MGGWGVGGVMSVGKIFREISEKFPENSEKFPENFRDISGDPKMIKVRYLDRKTKFSQTA